MAELQRRRRDPCARRPTRPRWPRAVGGDGDRDALMQGEQAAAQIGLRVAGQHAMGDMDEPRAGHLHHAPAHPGKAGIKAEDTDGRHAGNPRISAGSFAEQIGGVQGGRSVAPSVTHFVRATSPNCVRGRISNGRTLATPPPTKSGEVDRHAKRGETEGARRRMSLEIHGPRLDRVAPPKDPSDENTPPRPDRPRRFRPWPRLHGDVRLLRPRRRRREHRHHPRGARRRGSISSTRAISTAWAITRC